MKSTAKPWTRYALCICCAIAAFALTSFACISNQATANSYIDESRAYMGDDGLIYGVPFEGEDGLITMPDMTRVRATNGNYGYISMDEMYSAIIDYATTEEEKSQSVANVAAMRAPAFAHATERYFGTAALTAGELTALADGLHREGGYVNAQSSYSDLAAAPLAAAINQDIIERDVAIALVSEYAHEANETAIAPLSADGSNAQAVADAIESYAADIIDNRANAPITADQVTITSTMFDEIYEIAKAELAVPIPVYASDGTTVVGTYMVDRM